MIYMSRLGIWGEGTPFKTFEDFLHAIEKRSDHASVLDVLLRTASISAQFSSLGLASLYIVAVIDGLRPGIESHHYGVCVRFSCVSSWSALE